ncbi:hypothetical protein M0805_002555 [Coniferiporia weirii]|nr:hypothetical protein M0805_002555 [Coniferiporia weirii]
MSANSYHSSVEFLRAPVTRARELQVVDFESDKATASQAGIGHTYPSRPLCLPPSPPYTNPHLKRAIPLPLLDGGELRTFGPVGGPMVDFGDTPRKASSCGNGAETLLSPPYSPQRRLRTLLSVDEEEEELWNCDPSSEPSYGNSEHSWGRPDVSEESDQFSLGALDLEEDDDAWDDPLFLNAPSALELPSDGLELNLFGECHSSDDEDSLHSRPDHMHFPSNRYSSLDSEDESDDGSKPLFDPSHFDVFENSWDSTPPDSTRASLIVDSSHFSHHCLQQVGSFVPDEPVQIAPESPSRRLVIDLPEDEASHDTGLDSVDAPAPISNSDTRGTHAERLFEQLPLLNRTLDSPPPHQLFDMPSEIFQSPFSIPLIIAPSVTHSPPVRSLLFAPPEPQDVPLPDSPEGRIVEITDSDFNVPLHMLEEGRLRSMQQEMLLTEAHARSREAMLTEYIARLNAMRPPPLPQPVSITVPYCTSQSAIPIPIMEGIRKTDQHIASAMRFDVSHLEVQQHLSPVQPGPSVAPHNMPLQGLAPLDFFQARRREVQNAMAMRTAERRRRKRAKERGRELEALLQLKIGQLRVASAKPCLVRDADGEAIVLAASDSDQHLAHAATMLFDAADIFEQPPKGRRDDVRHLVAKMIFRRRDSLRPLSGKPPPPARSYVRSSLSRTIQVEVDSVDELQDIEEVRLS